MTEPTAAPPFAHPPKRRRRWRRRILFLFFFLVALVVLAPLALSIPFVREKVAAIASEKLGRTITIEKASAFWGKGVDLEGIVVASPEGFGAPLAQVESVHLDLDVFSLLGSAPSASVFVRRPEVNLLQDGAGRSNTDGLFPGQEKEENSEGGKVRLRLDVERGAIRAQTSPEAKPEEIRDLNVGLGLAPDGTIEVALDALAVGAAVGGGDARITVNAKLSPEDGGPVRANVPALDLARLAGLFEGAGGLRDLKGQVEVTAEGTSQPGPRVDGTLVARLSGISFVTSGGSPLRIDSLSATGRFEGESGRISIEGRNIDLGAGLLSEAPYREAQPKVELDVGFPKEGPITIRPREVTTALLALDAPTGDGAPLEIRIADGSPALSGRFGATAYLDPISRAFGKSLSLEGSETIGGTLRIDGEATYAGEKGHVEANLSGQALRFPARFGGGSRAENLTGKFTLDLDAAGGVAKLVSLQGLGLTANGEAKLEKTGETTELSEATFHATADLARAQPTIAALASLEPGTRLAGSLVSDVTLKAEGGGRRLGGQTVVTGLSWVQPGGGQVNEPQVTLKHDAWLAPEGGTHRIEDVRLVSQALTLALKGTAAPRGDASELDARLDVGGDAARLAAVLRGWLGPDYADLTGQGPIQGALTLKGSTAKGPQTLVPNGNLDLGTWSQAGATFSGVKVGVAKAVATAPTALTVGSGLNGGRIDANTELQFGDAATPWNAALKIAGVDTSPLLVDHGPGRFLSFLLPTLVPANVSVPVLSGRLDSEVKLAAGDLGEPVLENTLQGDGYVRMASGSLTQSTLFRSIGGGSGLGQVGQILTRAVPEVGQALASFTRAVTFSRLESRFVVQNRVVQIQQGLLEGQTLRLAFRGTVGFDKTSNVAVDMTLLGGAGDKLASVLPTKTIPLAVRGPLTGPQVVPNLKAQDLAAAAARGVLPGGGQNPIDRLKDLLGR